MDGNRRRDDDTLRRLADAGWSSVVVWAHEPVALAADRVLAAVDRRDGRR
jgi:DNA mismatch endonuclease (patch repair protein)